VTGRLVRRAEAAGYEAIVFTVRAYSLVIKQRRYNVRSHSKVDRAVLGRREADLRNRFELPDHVTVANVNPRDGLTRAGIRGSTYRADEFSAALTWAEFDSLKESCFTNT
jgi:isopentenyl diphosphate isomerase/L-lactate dehydrogenase-like FMN-dependent dehydrogenase